MIVPLPRTLKRGMRGRDVLMMRRALSRAGHGKWGVFWTGWFGPLLEKHLKDFQRKHGLKADGVYGLATHKKLAKFYDAYGAKVMNQLMPKQPVEVTQAIIGYNYRYLIHYTQSSARMSIVRWRIRDLAPWLRAGKQLWEDCSSWVTGLYYVAKRDDPNGYEPDYPGYGYTGTLSVRGKRVSFPKLGDLGFYGFSWPYGHVTICVGFKNGRPVVVSHGAEPGPLLLDYNYNGRFNHWRTYG